MSLSTLLLEASALTIPELKKAILKDERAAVIFKRDLTLDDIPNKDVFLKSIKFWIFNNTNVIEFVKRRAKIKSLDPAFFTMFRKLRAEELNSRNLELLVNFITALFKEYSAVERGTISTEVKKQLLNWMNSDGGYRSLSGYVSRELSSIPQLRPEKSVLLYRGLLFSKYSLEEKKKYDGTLEVGNGLKFLRSVRKGRREVDLSWDKESSWTTSKEIADRFAKYGPASSSYSATLQWLSRSAEKKFIDGELGFVISILAKPDDILVDTSRLRTVGGHLQHGSEGEMILKPGTYLCRIVKKYTTQGEVDPAEDNDGESDDKVLSALKSVDEFEATFVIPEIANEIRKLDVWGYPDAIQLVKNPEQFQKLIMNSTQTALIHACDKLNEWYTEKLADITLDELRIERFAHNIELSKKVTRLKKIVEYFNEKMQTPDKEKIPRFKLTGVEFRNTISVIDVSYLKRDLIKNGKITSVSSRQFADLCKYLNVDFPRASSIHMYGVQKQLPVIRDVFQKFFQAANVPEPITDDEAKSAMLNFLVKAYRNYKLIVNLQSFEYLLKLT